jgi:hypothetical protein
MGLYNTLTVEWNDEAAKEKCNLILQFKYGELWQHEYKIGDSVKWGEQSEGDRTAKEVMVEAILENDDIPNGLSEEFEILIKNNTIQEVRPLLDKMKYFNAGNNYIVINK